jgi:hypothetical protein
MPEKVSIPINNVVTTYYGKDSLLNKFDRSYSIRKRTELASNIQLH